MRPVMPPAMLSVFPQAVLKSLSGLSLALWAEAPPSPPQIFADGRPVPPEGRLGPVLVPSGLPLQTLCRQMSHSCP